MSAPSERTVIRWTCYLAFVAGAAGLAWTLGASVAPWAGWLVVLLAGAIPGATLLARALDDAQVARERERHAPEPWSAH